MLAKVATVRYEVVITGNKVAKAKYKVTILIFKVRITWKLKSSQMNLYFA